MNNTALSATHMVNISLREPEGGEMVKVRLQGTKDDMEWLEQQLKDCAKIQITEFSVVREDEVSKTYEFPKKLICIRSKVKTMSMTSEQKESAKSRLPS